MRSGILKHRRFSNGLDWNQQSERYENFSLCEATGDTKDARCRLERAATSSSEA